MRRIRRTVAVAALALAAVPATTAAHPNHATATPSGPLAGASPVGLGVGLAGLLLLTGAVLLTREDVLDERARSAGVGIGAALVVAGAAVAYLLP